MMKQHLESLIGAALSALHAKGELPSTPANIQIDPTRDKNHGDFACNIALVLSKTVKQAPRALAEKIRAAIPSSDYVKQIEIAGPGFINFFLSSHAMNAVIPRILAEKENYGRSQAGRNKKVIIEFVSSNPTGPLHVGHGRHASVGLVLSNLLNAVGFKTYKEYYVNDAGRQMDILAVSVWLRYLQEGGATIAFPANGYQGTYVNEIAHELWAKEKAIFQIPVEKIMEGLPADEKDGGDKEIFIDALITRAKTLLGPLYEALFELGLTNILTDIREDLVEFGVQFDHWFSERSLVKTGVLDKLIEDLKQKGFVYEKDQALWFRSSKFGDEKDRVLVRSNGQRTYFANDVAYHLNKFGRDFDIAIDVVGSDHHGYLARVKSALSAANIDPERLVFILLQFVSLYRQGKQVQMSTRGGNFVTLRELREEVGNDAARFFYLLRKSEQHMDFDLDLAKSKSNENPVYYVQYAYARICSVFRQLADKKQVFNEENGLKSLALLTESHEGEILNTLSAYPDMIMTAAISYEPHQLTNYLRKLAADFHAYYNSHHFIVDDVNLRDARLVLITAISQVLLNGFNLLGISAPESM